MCGPECLEKLETEVEYKKNLKSRAETLPSYPRTVWTCRHLHSGSYSAEKQVLSEPSADECQPAEMAETVEGKKLKG